jgi:acetyltransferase
MSTYRLERLFSPRSIALIGGSPRENSLGRIVLTNMKAAGFGGELHVVNPHHREIGGLQTLPAIDRLPHPPDVVVVTAPAPAVPQIISESAALGVSAAVVITAGLGHGAGSLAAKAAAEARLHGLRVVGPNGLGLLVPRAKVNASFAARMPPLGDLAVISQSGAIAAALVEWAGRRDVGFSAVVSLGDALDVDFGDLLDFFALDSGTRAILLYIESVVDARKFLSAARAAARTKPVVVVKSGRFAQGAHAAATHTGALAGADDVYDAAFRRAGLLRVLDLDELFAAAETLGHVRPFDGRRLAILTNGGGLGVLAVDQLVALGGSVAELSATAKADLDRVLPSTWSKANPIDITGDAGAKRYRDSLEVLLADEANDAVLAINVPTALASSAEAAHAVVDVVQQRRSGRMKPKPVFTVWFGEDPAASAAFSRANIPQYNDETDAVAGFMHLVRYREAGEALTATPPSLPQEFAPDLEAARAVVYSVISQGKRWLDPIETVRLLQAFAIPANQVLFARNAEEAAAAARPLLELGEKVVVKLFSPDIIHKSEVGGVTLNLASASAVRIAAAEMMDRAKVTQPSARLTGVTLHPMIVRPKARELIAGIADDPTFGPVIVFGRGGSAVEVIGDKALAFPPLDLRLAHELIGRTRVSRILRAYRNVPAADSAAVALTLVKLSQLAADLPEIRELDLNPLLADENGVLAVDSRIAVAPVDNARRGRHPRFAIRPYPAEWEGHHELRDGKKLLVRPVRPEDEPLYGPFLRAISPEDMRLRFFAPLKDFSHTFIARFTQIDYARAMAFIALDADSGAMLGVVRLHVGGEGVTGEYAILVRSDYKGRGLGWLLMQLIISYARAEGLRRIEGQVLRDNTTMLAMCQELGFSIRADPGDAAVVLVTMALGDSQRHTA